MRALTISPCWAHSIFHPSELGLKDVENRTWQNRSVIGKRIAIHAGSRFTERDDFPSSLFSEETEYWVGGIIGLVTIKDIVTASNSIHFDGAPFYGWLLSDPIKLSSPIDCKGALGLWHVPATIQSLILSQI